MAVRSAYFSIKSTQIVMGWCQLVVRSLSSNLFWRSGIKSVSLLVCPAWFLIGAEINPTPQGEYLSSACNMLVLSVCLLAHKLAINCLGPRTQVYYWLSIAHQIIM